jgi:hypothetical protein
MSRLSGAGTRALVRSRVDALGIEMVYGGPCMAAPTGRLLRPERAQRASSGESGPGTSRRWNEAAGQAGSATWQYGHLGLLTPVMRRRGVSRLGRRGRSSPPREGTSALLLHFAQKGRGPGSTAHAQIDATVPGALTASAGSATRSTRGRRRGRLHVPSGSAWRFEWLSRPPEREARRFPGRAALAGDALRVRPSPSWPRRRFGAGSEACEAFPVVGA